MYVQFAFDNTSEFIAVLIPLIAAPAIMMLVGLVILFSAIKRGRSLRERCTLPMPAKYVGVKNIRQEGSRVIMQTQAYELDYQGKTYYLKREMGIRREEDLHIGAQVELLIDPQKPTDYWNDEVEKSIKIRKIVGLAFSIVCGISIAPVVMIIMQLTTK